MESMDVKVMFTMSKEIPAKYGDIQIGKYTIEKIPSHKDDLIGENRYILHFTDELRDTENFSQPGVDAELFLSFFSLITQSRLDIDNWIANDVRAPATKEQKDSLHNYFATKLDPLPDFDNYLQKLENLDRDTARQFLRASEVYRLAMNISSSNKTISFFLLCVAIECLSNKMSNEDGTCEKFTDFILKYLPDKSDLDTDEEWVELLKEIYYHHRSGFVHGGKLVPEASDLADKLDRLYIKNMIDGKYVKTPSLKWFANVVHLSLSGFLHSIDSEEKKKTDYFKELSLEHGVVIMKVKRDIQAGRLVSADDVELG